MNKSYCPSLAKMPTSSLFYALSDPARVEIIIQLLDQDELTCGEFKSSLTKSTLSHHFKVLRESGIIKKREEGKLHYVSLRTDEIEKRLPGFIDTLRKMKKPY